MSASFERSRAAAWAIGVLGLLTLGVLFARPDSAAAAPADGFTINSFEASPSDTQAGGHPDVTLKFTNSTRISPFLDGTCRCNSLKEALVNFPEGVIGNPHATVRCTAIDFSFDRCPIDSQIGAGEAAVLLNDSGPVFGPFPVYNLIPLPGQAGLLGFKAPILNWPVYTVISARTGSDYGLDAEVVGINQSFAVGMFKQVLWGVPASPTHDSQRYIPNGSLPIPGASSNSPEVPFMQNPTTCSGPLESHLRAASYDGSVEMASASWPETTGCEQLGFNPSLVARPSTTEADTSTGLDIDLKVPQLQSPTVPTASQIRAVTVTFPEGFSINPNAADGKTTCSDAEARFGTPEEAQCPAHSKVGTLSLLSSALPEAIPGGIYLGDPKPGDRYRVIVTADGYGTHIKLPSSVKLDPRTGKLTAIFENLPQSPLSEFSMHFFGSERGLLATPAHCGTFAVNSEFTPWDADLASQSSTQFFKIDSGPGGSPCPGAQRPFAPTFSATGASNGAGSHGPFSITVNRADGDQNLSAITVRTPPGFSATLKGVPYCPESTLAGIAAAGGLAELTSPGCPAAAQVGIGWAGAGAGTHPLYVTSRIYLAGPYRGSPLSFAVVTPAVSGPYDLGNIVVRVGIAIDPANAQVTAVSDPLPQIVDGIPLRLRTVIFNLDRPNFTVNPTNCSPFLVEGLLTGVEGALATPSTHFQTANCDALSFAPKLTTSLTGSTKRRGHPALRAILTQSPAGEANIRRAAVTLPRSELLDQDHIGTVCTRVRFAAGSCPPDSVYGQAKATTPLLDSPLEGPVYLRSSSNELPDLVAALRGPASQPIAIDLVGRVDSINGGIRTTFDSIPDAAVSRFVLEMQGGKKGLLINSADLCKGKHLTDARIAGQNGKQANQAPALRAPCGSKAQRKKRGARAGRGTGR